MKYVFKWRRKNSWFWKKSVVAGHAHVPNQDKMVIYFEDGGLREISEWHLCEVTLGQDWVLATKKNMESQSGASVKLDTGG